MRPNPALSFASILLCACGGAPNATDTTPLGVSPVADASVERRPASLGVNQAALATSDPIHDGRGHYHVWRLELDGTQRVRVQMSSSALDPLIEVHGPNGMHLRNDDAFPGMLDAIVDFLPPAPGTYEITATSYGAGQTGAYTLSITPRDPAGIGVAFDLGGEATATLGRDGMQRDLPGTWMHFTGSAGAVVRLRVTSQAFDTIATLIGPGGQTWFNDDANDVGPEGAGERALDSTIVAALPDTGVYQLVITPYGGQGGGPFRVRSTARPPVVLTGAGRPEGLAGPDGGGRILGVYAGITAYQNQSQLYGCADDARLLGEAMRASHLQDASDQLVLPDGLATRQAFLGGIEQMAELARPEDVVLVFFSGHGQQMPDDATPDELDALDETILLFDGPIRDDEVVAALSRIRAGTVILALDSCHSGGFARDWVSQPGRVGLFSSDEDVLSDTAEPHRAGGYLSWHLRRGVMGEADARPRDGVLHAGELTDYLLDGFVADHRLMNPAGELDPAQRLVVTRGAVSWERVLWVYPRNVDFTLPALPSNPLTSAPP